MSTPTNAAAPGLESEGEGSAVQPHKLPTTIPTVLPVVSRLDRRALNHRAVVVVIRKRRAADGTEHTISRTFLTLSAAARAVRRAQERNEAAELVLCELRIAGAR